MKDLLIKEHSILNREWEKIKLQIKKIPFVTLNKPIQYGFNIILSFRNDIMNQDDIHNFESALKIATKPLFALDKSYVKKILDKDVSIGFVHNPTPQRIETRNKQYNETPHLRYIHQKEYNSLNGDVKKYFKRECAYEGTFEYVWYFLDVKSYQLKYTYEKNFIFTEKNVPIELIEKEEEMRRLVYDKKYNFIYNKTKSKKDKRSYYKYVRANQKEVMLKNEFVFDKLFKNGYSFNPYD